MDECPEIVFLFASAADTIKSIFFREKREAPLASSVEITLSLL